MSDNVKKFLEMASKDENLKNKLMELEKKEYAKAIQEAIALAKEHGMELSEADFAKDKASSELSDDELNAVSGGTICFFFAATFGPFGPFGAIDPKKGVVRK